MRNRSQLRAFEAKVARELEALAPPSSLLLAVSGGADSMALLEAAAHVRHRRKLAGIRFVVGHVDHGLRDDSAHDATLVRGRSQALGLAHEERRLCLRPGGNLEERAREARYSALGEMASAAGCDAVVTAHTATDQAETLLWRLARGTGPDGLAGMRPARLLVPRLLLLRPLLKVTRDETRAYCADSSVPFHDDPTNVDERPRARLRAEVLPVLERLAPGAALRIAEAAQRLADDADLLGSLLPPHEPSPSRDTLRALARPLRRRWLVDWFEKTAVSRRTLGARHIESLDRLVQTGRGEVELPSRKDLRCVARIAEGRLLLEFRP